MDRWMVAFGFFAVLLAGCIEPPMKLGCCLKENIAEGCMYYNTTDYTTLDFTEETYGLCDSNDTLYNTTGHCNVSIDGKYYLVPICTEDQIVSCIEPDCTAMVCGDYAFKPKIAPGFVSVEESEGEVPPESEEVAANFYKAQCRYLSMDARLRNIMKNSKAQINVFRIGVGGSFDEFDQYKYFFPMSDKFCSINPATGGVDRYMNYLTAESETYDPAEITTNCLSDISGDYGADSPFGFTEDASEQTSEHRDVGTFSYDPVVPDESNYKFVHHAIEDYWADWTSSADGYYVYDDPFVEQWGVYKKMDNAFYRKMLSIAHVETIYGLGDTGTTRAPFECNSGGSDCYSGMCNTQTYSRGVFVEVDEEDGGMEFTDEFITDCNKVTDELGITKIVCAPTKTVIPQGEDPPIINYASVQVVPAHIEGTSNPRIYFSQLASDAEAVMMPYWENFDSAYGEGSISGGVRSTVNTLNDVSLYTTTKSECPDYDSSYTCPSPEEGETGVCLPLVAAISSSADEDEDVQCFDVTGAAEPPPAGGAVFFGKLGDSEVRYGGDIIIGYAIASPGEFNDMLLAKNCEFDSSGAPPRNPGEICYASDLLCGDDGGATTCRDECGPHCPGMEAECNAWCSATWTMNETTGEWENSAGLSAPCVDTDPSNTVDYVRVELDGPDDPDWERLMDAFEPYYMQRVESMKSLGFSDGCGQAVQAEDVVLSSMPWVINYKKSMTTSYRWRLFGEGAEEVIADISYHLSSVSSQELRERNIYDEPMVDTPGTSSCELRRTNVWTLFSEKWNYDIAFSKYIYLFKYKPNSKKIGKCAVDDTTYMPMIKTYGWCEPCTTSTLAYQNVTLNELNRVYMPAYTANVEDDEYKNLEPICRVNYDIDWDWLFGIEVSDNVSCSNRHITDISDYKDSIAAVGSPRTVPEASIMKERLGNYLKSGIMPVLDLSDDSNWNQSNPDGVAYGGSFRLFYWSDYWEDPESSAGYARYDFERLIGDMGAAVVIVGHVDGEADDATREQIINRSGIVRERCFGCLTAFHVDNPLTRTSFNNSINSVLTDPRAQFNIDMITFDYQISEHLAPAVGGAEFAAWEIAEYGRTALQSKQKPTMVVGLNVNNDDGTWDSSNSQELFEAIIAGQDTLVRAGVMGIIYSPVRDDASDEGQGLVMMDAGGGNGLKSDKFCAFQSGMQQMTMTRPAALFTRMPVLDNVSCTRCSSLEVGTVCGPYTDAILCDNGVACELGDLNLTKAKCPEDVVAGECTLCNETGLDYTCTLTYTNGTIETIGPHPMSEIDSDLYLDIIGGLSKPDKCCLEDAGGARYTYSKDAFPSSVNVPIVFPKSGDPNVDCGMGDTGKLSELGTFCNIEIPIRDYDINCSVG